MPLAEGGQVVLTGRLSLRPSRGWPTTWSAAGCCCPAPPSPNWRSGPVTRPGCGAIEELTIEAPRCVLDGAAHLQVVVGEPGDEGRRTVTVHSRDEDAPADRPWTRHADRHPRSRGHSRRLRRTSASTSGRRPAPEPVDVTGFYDDLPGFAYGPAFQGVRAAWRRDADVYLEIATPAADTAAYGLHPALLDAALHGAFLADDLTGGLPFTWSDVTLHASGAASLRVRLTPRGTDAVSADRRRPDRRAGRHGRLAAAAPDGRAPGGDRLGRAVPGRLDPDRRARGRCARRRDGRRGRARHPRRGRPAHAGDPPGLAGRRPSRPSGLRHPRRAPRRRRAERRVGAW